MTDRGPLERVDDQLVTVLAALLFALVGVAIVLAAYPDRRLGEMLPVGMLVFAVSLVVLLVVKQTQTWWDEP